MARLAGRLDYQLARRRLESSVHAVALEIAPASVRGGFRSRLPAWLLSNVRVGAYIRGTVTSVALAPENLMSRSDAAAYVAWLRREQLFRDCLRDLRLALGREDRDEPWSDSDPEQLPRHATDARRSARFLDSVQKVSSVLPPSARGLWSLLLDEAADFVVGPGKSLTREEWERLTTTVRARLIGDGSDLDSDRADGAEATFLERALSKIDPATPVLMPAAWASSAISRSDEVVSANGWITTVTAAGEVFATAPAPPSPHQAVAF